MVVLSGQFGFRTSHYFLIVRKTRSLAGLPISERERHTLDTGIYIYRRVREIGRAEECRCIVSKAKSFLRNAEEILVELHVNVNIAARNALSQPRFLTPTTVVGIQGNSP